MEITQINQVWNLLHSITKPFQQAFTGHHISWTKEFCTSLWFPDFLCCYCHKNSVKIPSKYDNSNIIFLNVNLIINKRVRVLIFLFWDSWSSTSLKSVFEKWPVTVFKCALFPGRCQMSFRISIIVKFCVEPHCKHGVIVIGCNRLHFSCNRM